MRKLILKLKPSYIIIILLTLISQRICYNDIVNPKPEWRMEMQNSILNGEAGTPYQYRILKPMLGKTIQTLLSPIVKNDISRHLLSYKILLYIVFFFIFILFYLFLRHFYSNITAIIGLLLLQVLIPLSITNEWQEGDFITLLLYTAAFLAIVKKKDFLIPLIIFIGAFNRDQIIYILAFYGAWLYQEKKLFKSQSIFIIAASIVLFISVYFGLRFYFGFKPVVHTIAFNTGANIQNWSSILRLWIEQVFIFILMVLVVYRKSMAFFRYSALLLIPYTILFFLYGIMGELAKYFPAYLVMITMGIQMVNGEYTKKSNAA